MTDFDFDISNGVSNGGTFFKPKEYQQAAVIIFEPKGVRENVQSQFGPKDYTDGDFTIFLTEAELKKKAPSEEIIGGTCEGALAKSLASKVGKLAVGKLGQVPTKKGNPAWVVDSIDPKLIPAVKEYLVDREKKRQDELPDFLKG